MGFEEMALGAAGIGLFSTMLYYNLAIMNNFKEHEDLSLAMFFLDEKGPVMFQLVVSATVIYSLGMLYASLAIPYDARLLNLYSKATSIILFLVFTIFMRHVAYITSKREPEE
jgi:hypothetical protein